MWYCQPVRNNLCKNAPAVLQNSRSIFRFSFFRDCIPYTAYSLPLSPRHSHSFVLNSCCLSWQRRNNPHGVSSLISCSAHIYRSPARLMMPNQHSRLFFRRHRSLLYHPADRCGISSLLHLSACRAFRCADVRMNCPYRRI